MPGAEDEQRSKGAHGIVKAGEAAAPNDDDDEEGARAATGVKPATAAGRTATGPVGATSKPSKSDKSESSAAVDGAVAGGGADEKTGLRAV
jgi:hypothetical protein